VEAQRCLSCEVRTLSTYKESEAISVTDREDSYGCEMLRIPHFLQNQLTDGGEAVSLTCRPRSTTAIHLEVERTQIGTIERMDNVQNRDGYSNVRS
jgi:hypothetical protein